MLMGEPGTYDFALLMMMMMLEAAIGLVVRNVS